MLRLLLVFIICCTFALVSKAQNLVPNPSFEDTVGCPQQLYEVSQSKHWSVYRSSPDYYHRCAPFDCSIPNNSNGYQEPLNINDNGYAGIITYLDFLEYREYLGVQLSHPLIIGNKYFVSLRISLANSSKWATDKVGVKFSTIQYSDTGNLSPNPQPIDNNAQIFATNIISDTSKWITITGTFISDSSYQFISIGNFFNDTLTNRIHLDSLWGVAYYFIDNICVSDDSLGCYINVGFKDNHLPSNCNFYPNPARNKIYFNTEADIEIKCSIITLWGSEVLSRNIYGNEGIDISEIPVGVYFIKAEYQNKTFFRKQLVIH